MSDKYQPKKGDRVRVTLEGIVTHDGGPDISVEVAPDTRLRHVVWTNANGVTVERVSPPLPTTPGSVIKARLDYEEDFDLYMLGEDDRWRRSASGAVPLRGNDFEYDEVHVLFDAGATK